MKYACDVAQLFELSPRGNAIKIEDAKKVKNAITIAAVRKSVNLRLASRKRNCALSLFYADFTRWYFWRSLYETGSANIWVAQTLHAVDGDNDSVLWRLLLTYRLTVEQSHCNMLTHVRQPPSPVLSECIHHYMYFENHQYQRFCFSTILIILLFGELAASALFLSSSHTNETHLCTCVL